MLYTLAQGNCPNPLTWGNFKWLYLHQKSSDCADISHKYPRRHYLQNAVGEVTSFKTMTGIMTYECHFIANVKQWGHRLYAFTSAKGGNL